MKITEILPECQIYVKKFFGQPIECISIHPPVVYRFATSSPGPFSLYGGIIIFYCYCFWPSYSCLHKYQKSKYSEKARSLETRFISNIVYFFESTFHFHNKQIQVIRIRSDNPGKWFLHCHIEVHSLDGMGMVINEAPDHPLKPPKGFPSCVNFYDDHSRDIDYAEQNAKYQGMIKSPFVYRNKQMQYHFERFRLNVNGMGNPHFWNSLFS